MSASKSARKFFLCTGECVRAEQLQDYPNSHIIGELHYVIDESQSLTALARWEESISTRVALPIKPEIDVEIVGDARNIKCRFPQCRNKKRWEISRLAFLQLSKRYSRLDV